MLVSGVRLAAGPELVDLETAEGMIVAIRPARTDHHRPTASELRRGGAPAPERVLLPAFVDLHTHLREPGGEASETLHSGTAAAAAGGYTDVFAMANTDPPTDRVERVRALRARAAGLAAGVHPVSAATMDLAGTRLVDVESITAEGVRLFSDDGRCLDDPALVRELLNRLASTGGVFAQHAQSAALVADGVIDSRVAPDGVAGWPAVGEEAVIARDLALARDTGGHLHLCHVSTAGSVELIRDAKRRGVLVTAEVTPHHLELTADDALQRGAALKVNPPLRSRGDVRALRSALIDGTIDAVATDHAPHPAAAKRLPWSTAAFGLTALETALPVVADALTDPCTGAVDWRRLTEVMSHVPAAIGGIDAVAGRPIRIGEPASFTVVERCDGTVVRSAEHLSRSRNTPFEGRAVKYRVAITVRNGHTTFERARSLGRATPGAAE